ncbi:MAG: ABC transporter ATP-binding protein [Candidatus Cloacimonetes bacterium]|nr:ABC transporter ATP-binding protein [Candidatus Cloacimonadota bacterium]
MELEIRNLSKTYSGGVKALQGIEMRIGQGMFGLLGPNGAGKSTLMRTIATLQEADRGEILLDGTDVLHNHDHIRRILGYLPQEFGLYDDMTTRQMLMHIAMLKGITSRSDRKRAAEHIMQQTNLHQHRNRKLGQFSGGMKQRFGIAQALLGDPRLIIVDEPTAGLDPEERNRFYNILSAISEDRIVILSTHIVEDIRVLCQHMAVLHQGQLLFSGSTEEALAGLKGRIWQRIITKEEIQHFGDYNIILTRMMGGRILLHVLSEKEIPGFSPVEPDLEDVYFHLIRN